MKFHDNARRPFGRKVRMVLDRKGALYGGIDGLGRVNAARSAS